MVFAHGFSLLTRGDICSNGLVQSPTSLPFFSRRHMTEIDRKIVQRLPLSLVTLTSWARHKKNMTSWCGSFVCFKGGEGPVETQHLILNKQVHLKLGGGFHFFCIFTPIPGVS